MCTGKLFKALRSFLLLLFILCVSLLSPGWTGVNERTFIAVKPDGVQRKLVGEIVRRFERKGFKLVGLKLVQVLWFSYPSDTFLSRLTKNHFFAVKSTFFRV